MRCFAIVIATLVGCVPDAGSERCTEGERVACTCAEGAPGVRSCTSSLRLGVCDCAGAPACADGASYACRCASGGTGAARCGADGALGACTCTEVGVACIPGRTLACACLGTRGVTRCGADGVLSACECDERCVPGRAAPCTCAAGVPGTSVCGDDERPGACVCLAFDAGASLDTSPEPDGGRCDPYAGALCTCPEALPPAVPVLLPPADVRTIGSGPETLVDVLAVEAGVVVVLSGGARLLDRATGAVLGAYSTPRRILNAATAGASLVLGDGGKVTVLSATDLSFVRDFVVAEECAQAAVISCDRVVCGSGREWDRVFYTYDLGTGAELARSVPVTYAGTPMQRVPGLDAFVTVTDTLSPSDWHFHRVEPDGRALYVGESSYHGDFRVTATYAFVGWPATHLMTDVGAIFAIDGCWRGDGITLPERCFVASGALGTLPGDASFVAMASLPQGQVAAVLVEPEAFPSMGARRARLQRFDVPGRRIAAERELAFVRQLRVVLAHDPWSDAALVGVPTSCDDRYPYPCDGWDVRWVPYD